MCNIETSTFILMLVSVRKARINVTTSTLRYQRTKLNNSDTSTMCVADETSVGVGDSNCGDLLPIILHPVLVSHGEHKSLQQNCHVITSIIECQLKHLEKIN